MREDALLRVSKRTEVTLSLKIHLCEDTRPGPKRCMYLHTKIHRGQNEDVYHEVEDTPEKWYNVVSLKRIVKCVFWLSLELWRLDKGIHPGDGPNRGACQSPWLGPAHTWVEGWAPGRPGARDAPPRLWLCALSHCGVQRRCHGGARAQEPPVLRRPGRRGGGGTCTSRGSIASRASSTYSRFHTWALGRLLFVLLVCRRFHTTHHRPLYAMTHLAGRNGRIEWGAVSPYCRESSHDIQVTCSSLGPGVLRLTTRPPRSSLFGCLLGAVCAPCCA